VSKNFEAENYKLAILMNGWINGREDLILGTTKPNPNIDTTIFYKIQKLQTNFLIPILFYLKFLHKFV
jgi:hypothetical protein